MPPDARERVKGNENLARIIECHMRVIALVNLPVSAELKKRTTDGPVGGDSTSA
jgi:hypothetical protein